MESKRIIWIFTIIGGWLGGYIPLLWGANLFSISGVIFSALGGILGIWVGFNLTR